MALISVDGADPNAQDERGDPALFIARNGNMLSTLLDDPRANLHAKDAVGNTLLTAAIGGRKPDVVRLLLDRGADPNEAADVTPVKGRASAERIPLFIAIQFDQSEGYQIVKALIEARGINVNVKNDDGLAPKEFAEKLGNKDIVEILEM